MREIGFLVVFFLSSCCMKGSTKKEKLGKLAAAGFALRDGSMRDPLILAESGYLAMMEFAP